MEAVRPDVSSATTSGVAAGTGITCLAGVSPYSEKPGDMVAQQSPGLMPCTPSPAAAAKLSLRLLAGDLVACAPPGAMPKTTCAACALQG
jgi:hypothetical protein